jgi:hypothetical protein
MSLFPLKPTHAPVKNYYAALAQFHLHGHDTEGNTRSAFADLLKKCCHPDPFTGTGNFITRIMQQIAEMFTRRQSALRGTPEYQIGTQRNVPSFPR